MSKSELFENVETVYIVVSEEWYGGDHIRVFNTSTAKEDAEAYARNCAENTENKIDFIVKQVYCASS